ncbi:MAG: hypothetical protein RIR39_1815 [Pseudomonadota bacterium]
MSVKTRLEKLESKVHLNLLDNMTREEKVARLKHLMEESKARGCPDCQDCINPELCKRIEELESKYEC